MGHEWVTPIPACRWSPLPHWGASVARPSYRRWSPMPHWGERFADYRTIGDASAPIPRIMRTLTRCVLIVSSRIVSIEIVSVLIRCVLTISSRIVSSRIVSVLIIGGWMMSVRRIDAPGRALA